MTKAELHKLIDELPDSAVEGAGVLLRGIIKGPIDPDQAWFWTPEWHRGSMRQKPSSPGVQALSIAAPKISSRILRACRQLSRTEGADARRAAPVPS